MRRRGKKDRDRELAEQQPGKGRKWEIIFYLQNLKKAALFLDIAQASTEFRRMKD